MHFCYLLLLLAVALLGGSSADQEVQSNQAKAKPNIVIILADDQGWGDLSMNGNPVVATPNIDGMARRGATLDRFYVNAVCSPTRAAMLTGRYAVRGGVYSTSAGGERLDLDETTFAEHFAAAGYSTGAFGKWHNGMQPPYHPNARGFERFVGYCSGHWGSYFDAWLEYDGVPGDTLSKGYLTDYLTEQAISFIKENANQPFLTYLPLNTPHSPMQVPDRWFNKFADIELPKHRYAERDHPEHTKAAYAMAENIDWNVGRILSILDQLNLSENTIVLYFSDNGPNGWRWNGGMEGIKGSTNEGGVRSPFVIQWPRSIHPGRKIPQIASVIDLFPTLLELAQIDYRQDQQVDGLSLAPLLLGKNTAWPDRFIVNHWKDQTSVRNQQFRLDFEDQLFNMNDDPGQTVDVRDSFPIVYEQLMAAKKKWRSEVMPELDETTPRPFPLAHPAFNTYQLPARDGKAHGNITRSNRWPNCSFYTNWTAIEDSITWDVEVLETGAFDPIIYYTCPQNAIGSEMTVTLHGEKTTAKITEAFDPPLRGAEHDRFERGESYVKNFKKLHLPPIKLKKGSGLMTLKATKIPGDQVMDFRMLLLNRID